MALKLTLGVVLLTWVAGTLLLFATAPLPPNACRAPFYTYAIAWPIFMALPEAGKMEFVRLSFIPCRIP